MDTAAPPSVPLWRRPGPWLVVAAVAHAVSPLLVLGAHWAFGPDETVYLSQLNHRIPPTYFSAPRARGATLIAAPVTLLTSSVAAVRLWVAALSGLGLWLAFRPWLTLVRGWVVPVAAAAFAGLWTVVFYGFEVMPNEWVAFATLGACGAVLRWFADGRRSHLLAAAAALTVVGLLRPSDAAYAAFGLGLGALLVRAPWRARASVLVALAVGTVAGVAQWVIEAETSFGGVGARVAAAQAEQGGSGLFWAGGAQVRTLAGPLLCRGGCHADAAWPYRLWWIALGALVLVAVGVALRRRHARSVVLLPVLTGLVVAAQYLLTVPYSAPRFLIPAYALLAVPAMVGARDVLAATRRRSGRVALSAVLVTALVAAVAVQVAVLTQHVRPSMARAATLLSAQADDLTDVGVTTGCVLLGTAPNNLQLSYALGCTNGPRTAAQIRAALDAGRQVVWLRAHRPSRYGGHWQHVLLPHALHSAWVGSDVALAPAD